MRVALVTGAAGGIGAAIVARLAEDGWSVHGVDIADADLTTAAGNRAVVEGALERYGQLDAVVANAGFQHVESIRDFPEEQWDALIALLLTSPFLLAKYAWDALAASGDGRFCAVSSVHGLVASPFKAGYVSAKHGVLGLVKTIALEGACRRDHGHRDLPRLCPHAARRGAGRRSGPRLRRSPRSRCWRRSCWRRRR